METTYKDYYIFTATNVRADLNYPFYAWVMRGGFRDYLVGGNSEKHAIQNAKKAIDHKCDQKYIYND